MENDHTSDNAPTMVRHPFVSPTGAADFLGLALSIACDGTSPLVVPKSLSVDLFAAVLLEKYVASMAALMDQFRDDIDEQKENTPDAISLSDFYELAHDIADQHQNCVVPIADLCRRCPLITSVCDETAVTITTFLKSVRRLTLECVEELCETLSLNPRSATLEDRFAMLQGLDFPKRKRQFSMVQGYLNQLQIEARDASDALKRQLEKTRQNAGALRRWLQATEDVCNTHGNLKRKVVTDALSQLKLV